MSNSQCGNNYSHRCSGLVLSGVTFIDEQAEASYHRQKLTLGSDNPTALLARAVLWPFPHRNPGALALWHPTRGVEDARIPPPSLPLCAQSQHDFDPQVFTTNILNCTLFSVPNTYSSWTPLVYGSHPHPMSGFPLFSTSPPIHKERERRPLAFYLTAFDMQTIFA